MNRPLSAATVTICVFIMFVGFVIGCGCRSETGDQESTQSTGKISNQERVDLPDPLPNEMTLHDALTQRRSKRQYTGGPLSLQEISNLLWAAQGITDQATGFRTAPSAGALYPLDIYLVYDSTVYHYLPEDQEIERHKEKINKDALTDAAIGQAFVGKAPAVFVITGDQERTEVKYGTRSERYVILEAGHACQNLLLEAVALGLGAVPVGAFDDGAVSDLLSLPGDHQPLYIVPVGHTEE